MFSDSFPDLLRYTGTVSSSGRDAYLRWTGLLLLTALVGAVGGGVSHPVTVHGQKIDIPSAVAGVAFLAGIGVSVRLARSRPQSGWYQGRAATESIKTLSWQYSVAGGIFGRDRVADADALFVARLREISQALTIDMAEDIGGGQISAAMRRLRDEPVAVRRDTYLADRLEDQCDWYSRRAEFNRKRVRRWLVTSAVLQGLGVIGAVARTFAIADVDFLGIAATAAASATAWLQAKDHQNLAESYAVTARERCLIRTHAKTLADDIDEDRWAEFVEDAEQAISREHTLWLARRGAVPV